MDATKITPRPRNHLAIGCVHKSMIDHAEKLAVNGPETRGMDALRLAVDRALVSLHMQGMTEDAKVQNLFDRYGRGEIELLDMSFELEAHLEASDAAKPRPLD